jgi:hypothetical protein
MCVAILRPLPLFVSHDCLSQNNPLYIKSFDETESELKFHYIVHTSLDIVAEKGRHTIDTAMSRY